MLRGYALVLVRSYLIFSRNRDEGDLEKPHPFQVYFPHLSFTPGSVCIQKMQRGVHKVSRYQLINKTASDAEIIPSTLLLKFTDDYCFEQSMDTPTAKNERHGPG